MGSDDISNERCPNHWRNASISVNQVVVGMDVVLKGIEGVEGDKVEG